MILFEDYLQLMILFEEQDELNDWMSNYKAFLSVSRKPSTKYVESVKQ